MLISLGGMTSMFNNSNGTAFIGLLLILISSVMISFDVSKTISYTMLLIGFILIGVGVLWGFIKMVFDDKVK